MFGGSRICQTHDESDEIWRSSSRDTIAPPFVRKTEKKEEGAKQFLSEHETKELLSHILTSEMTPFLRPLRGHRSNLPVRAADFPLCGRTETFCSFFARQKAIFIIPCATFFAFMWLRRRNRNAPSHSAYCVPSFLSVPSSHPLSSTFILL